ncbi:hypothetical protein VTN31DRAFT_67 [Thermomyces dupontii]|uniref:uncharacterized protein n=1 Tax=Talaromyces thermophilus TaxID=28565 RepID=UPI0037434133
MAGSHRHQATVGSAHVLGRAQRLPSSNSNIYNAITTCKARTPEYGACAVCSNNFTIVAFTRTPIASRSHVTFLNSTTIVVGGRLASNHQPI